MNYAGKSKLVYRTASAVTTAAYIEVSSAISSTATRVSIYNGTDQSISLAVGAAGLEVIVANLGEGAAQYSEDILINEGERIAIKSNVADTTSGELCLNFWG